MMQGRSLLRWAGTLITVVLVSMWGHEAQSSAVTKHPVKRFADIITIDAIGKKYSKELPAVTFRHDLHTKAVTQDGKDCSTCHQMVDGKLTPVFKREANKEYNATNLKDIYHTNCFSCHTAQAAKGKATGPQEGECRSCHTGSQKEQSSRQPIRMDKSLHYRHIAAKSITVNGKDTNCSACHHIYDENTKTLLPADGKEDACRTCHTAQRDTSTSAQPSLAEAAHTNCISCHLATTSVKAKSGPVECAGCHSLKAQAQYKIISDVPRLKRGQPDAALIVAKGKKKMTSTPVAFNHILHEEATDSCQTCHHKRIGSCTECHTIEGTKEGGYVQIEQAMHSVQSQASCVGCHQQAKADPSCAGCHDAMPAATGPSASSCATCHITDSVQPEELQTMSQQQRNQLAEALVTHRKTQNSTYALEDIPEEVLIDALVNEYEAAKLPHRKIVQTMLAAMGDNALAANFHTTPGTFCQGCHHNSPASKNPPKCSSCHGKPFQNMANERPGLKAAYHQQCMGCHDSMKIEKPKATACADCHAERDN